MTERLTSNDSLPGPRFEKTLFRRGKPSRDVPGCHSISGDDETSFAQEIELNRSGSGKIRKAVDKIKSLTKPGKSNSWRSTSESSQRQFPPEMEEIIIASTDIPGSQKEREEQQILPTVQFLRDNTSDAKKVLGALDVLYKLIITHPHLFAAEAICQAMNSNPDNESISLSGIDAALNLRCTQEKIVIDTAISTAERFKSCGKLQAKLIPIIGNNRVDLVIDAMSRNVDNIEVIRQGCLYFSYTTLTFDHAVQSEVISVLSIVLFVHVKISDLVVSAFGALLNFIKCDFSKKKMREFVLLEDVVSLLTLHNNEQKLVSRGMEVIMHLADERGSETAESGKKAKEVVLEVMENFPKRTRIQELGCRILFHLPGEADHERLIIVLLNALESLQHSTTVLTLLASLTSNSEFTQTFVAFDGLPCVVKKMNDSKEKLTAKEKGCLLLVNILKCSSGDKVVEFEAVTNMLMTMSDCLHSAYVQSTVLVGLYYLAMRDPKALAIFDCGNQILVSMREHLSDPYVQEYGCAITTILIIEGSDVMDHTDGLVAMLAALIEHSSDKKVFNCVCGCLKAAFEHYADDPLWIHEFSPMVESACFDFPKNLKTIVIEAMNVSRASPPQKSKMSERQLYEPEDSLNVFILVPPSLNEIDVISKITENEVISHSKDQTIYSNVGIEKYDWYPRGYNKDSVIKLHVFRNSTLVPLEILLSREALFILIWNIEDNLLSLEENYSQDTKGDISVDELSAGRSEVLSEDFYHLIDENVIHWIRLIDLHAPGALVLPTYVASELVSDDLLYRVNCMVQMQMEQNYSAQNTNGQPHSRPNVIFDESNEIKLRIRDDKIFGFADLRAKILSMFRMKQHLFLHEEEMNHPDTLQVLGIIRELQQFFDVMEINECYTYIQTLARQTISDKRIQMSLHFLDLKGEIVRFNDLGNEVQNESYVVLKPSWIVAAVGCIFQGESFEELALEIREIKRDLDIDDGEKNPSHETYLNFPMVTTSNVDLLLKNSVLDVDEKHAKLLRVILIRLGVLQPIEIGTEIEGQESYFIPDYLEVEDNSYWSYKCSNSQKMVVCSSWLLEGPIPDRIMIGAIKLILEGAHDSTQIPEGNESGSLTTQKKISLCEALCWKNAMLLKFAVKVRRSIDDEYAQEFVEISVYYGDKSSSLCVSSDRMKNGQKRIVLSAKGPSKYGMDVILNGGFLLCSMALQTILNSCCGLNFLKQIVCPDCLATFRIQQAETFECIELENHEDNKPIKCQKGHSVPRDLLRL